MSLKHVEPRLLKSAPVSLTGSVSLGMGNHCKVEGNKLYSLDSLGKRRYKARVRVTDAAGQVFERDVIVESK